MSGVTLGVEIFVGFLIGGLLLTGLVVVAPYLVFCTCFAWHFFSELLLLRALPRIALYVSVVTIALLYTWTTYELSKSPRPLAEHIADVMEIAAGLAILAVGAWLIVRIVPRGPAR